MRGLFYSVDASDLAIDEERAGVAPSPSPHSKQIVTRGLLKSVASEISLFFDDQIKGHLGEAGLRSRAFG